ncbi:MAG TPA: MlaD family protein, partial [Geobacteraceae bacterium]
MSKTASKTLIGAFVLGAVALAIVLLIILGSGRLFSRTFINVMYFRGSVKGLNVGAPVMFRGVKVGSVKKIELIYDA